MTTWSGTHVLFESQHDLGLPISSFDNIGRSGTGFLWELIQKDNDSQEQQVIDMDLKRWKYLSCQVVTFPQLLESQ